MDTSTSVRPKAARARRARWLRRAGIAAAVVIVGYPILGFLGVPLIVRHLVVPRLDRVLGGTATVGRVAFNPFTFRLRLEQLAVVDEAAAPVLGFERFDGNFQLLSTVFGSGYHFRSAQLTRPSLRAEFDEAGRFNLAPLWERPSRDRDPTQPRARLVIGELGVAGATIEFRDASLPEPFELTVQDADLVVHGLDTQPEHENVHRATAKTASGARIDWEGTLQVDPLTAHGTIRITDAPILQGMPYVVARTEGRIVGGRLQAELTYEFAPAADPEVARITVVEARLDDLAVEHEGQPLLGVAGLSVSDARVDAVSRTVSVAGMASSGTRIRVRRDPSGEYAVRRLVPREPGSAADAGQDVLATAGPAGTGVGDAQSIDLESIRDPILLLARATRELLERSRQPWSLGIGQIDVSEYAADISDLSAVPPVELTLATDRLTVAGVAVETADRTLAIESIAVIGPTLRGTVGMLPDAAAGETADADTRAPVETTADAATPLRVSVGTVRIESGAVEVRDDRSEPPALVSLDDMALELTGVSTDGGAIPFRAGGRLQGSGGLETTGSLDLFRAQPRLTLDTVVTDLPLKPYDPLAGPRVGYRIDSGRLTMKLPLTLDEGHIEGTLDFTFDNLHLGEKVDSPHAPDAPIKLGLDLLRDRNDRIQGRIPIAGDVNDPSFSIQSLIWDAFLGFLVKGAAAPFNLLASVFGGDTDVEDISLIEFEPGSATLTADALVRLDVLARALRDRPALALEAVGRYHAESDERGLRMVILRERLLGEIRERTKLIEALTDESYRTLVTQLYERELGADAGNGAVSFEQMEAALLVGIEVPGERRVALARRRAEAVVGVLVRDNGVPEQQITLTVPEADDLTAESPRVDFVLGAR